MPRLNSNSDWSTKFESVCMVITFFVICIASPTYGVLSLNNLPMV